MQVQKKDKDGRPMFDDKGQAIMEEGNANPDPNETARKFTELEKRLTEADGKLMATVERANRAESLLESYIRTGKPDNNQPPANNGTPGTIDVSRLVTEPDKVLGQVITTAVDQAVKIMEKRYLEAEGMKRESEGIRANFYKTNTDLVGFEKIVGLVEQEYRMRFPSTPYSSLLPEIAKAARAEVLDMKNRLNPGGGNPPLSLENGGGAPRKLGENEAPVIVSEENDFASYMDERNKVRSKKLG